AADTSGFGHVVERVLLSELDRAEVPHVVTDGVEGPFDRDALERVRDHPTVLRSPGYFSGTPCGAPRGTHWIASTAHSSVLLDSREAEWLASSLAIAVQTLRDGLDDSRTASGVISAVGSSSETSIASRLGLNLMSTLPRRWVRAMCSSRSSDLSG